MIRVDDVNPVKENPPVDTRPPPPPGFRYVTMGTLALAPIPKPRRAPPGPRIPPRAPARVRQPPKPSLYEVHQRDGIKWVGQMWERQPRETAKAWTWFKAYRDLGPTRTRSRIHEGPDAIEGTKRSSVDKQAATWKWAERVRAYDLHMDQVEQRATELEIKRMAKRQIKMGEQFQSVGLQWVEALQERVAAADDSAIELLDRLTGNTALRFAEVGVDIERRARGADAVEEVGPPASIAVNVKLDVFTRIDAMAQNYRTLQEMSAPIETTLTVVEDEDEQATG